MYFKLHPCVNIYPIWSNVNIESCIHQHIYTTYWAFNAQLDALYQLLLLIVFNHPLLGALHFVISKSDWFWEFIFFFTWASIYSMKKWHALLLKCYIAFTYVVYHKPWYKFRWFSPGTPVSSTNKTDRHDITVLNFLTLQDKHIIRTLSGKIKLICTRLETNRNK